MKGRIFIFAMSAWLVLSFQSCVKQASVAEMLEASSVVTEVLWDTTYALSPGVNYSELTLMVSGDERQQVHFLEVDPGCGYGLKVVLPDNSMDVSSGWKRQELTGMADALSSAGMEIVTMTNADFWNMSEPINPRGPLHTGGVCISSSWDYSDRVPQQALSFVGITKDGVPVIKARKFYESMKESLVECTGAGVIMLEGGEVAEDRYNLRDPRTAFGYRADGTVWFLVAEGRGFSGATGLTYGEMGEMFRALGCEAAVNLDGGGSSQMLIRVPETGERVIANSPTDGKQRPVVCGWAVIKK